MPRRLADPYRDLAVIDARAPRFNQAAVAVVCAVAFATRLWPLLALMALQLAIGLVFGRRACLPCRFYFEVVQPRLGEGPLEDARPPRFASTVGAIFLAASLLAHAVGQHALGWALAAAVAALAAIAAATGLCVGCKLYWVVALVRRARLRSISERSW